MNEAMTRYRPYLAMMFLFVLVLIGTIFFLRQPEPTALAMSTPTPRPTPTLASLTVDVRGAINKPGVYTLAALAVACKMRSRLPVKRRATPTPARSTSRVN